MSRIYYATAMKEMPKSCIECFLCQAGTCKLPDKKNNKDDVKKRCIKKRHENCPLVEVSNE